MWITVSSNSVSLMHTVHHTLELRDLQAAMSCVRGKMLNQSILFSYIWILFREVI